MKKIPALAVTADYDAGDDRGVITTRMYGALTRCHERAVEIGEKEPEAGQE